MEIDFYNKLCDEFTSDEENIFIKNFHMYLNYDQSNDFVIDFNTAFEYIGFSRKDNAKKVLVNNFELDKDYQIHKQDKNPNGGSSKENILLTPNTFKDFCLKSNTPIAKRTRTYYIKMENTIFKFMKEMITNLIKEKEDINEKLMDSSTKIQYLNTELNKYKNKKQYAVQYEMGDTVYVVIEVIDTHYIMKVGKSLIMTERARSYYGHSNNPKIVYTIRCIDSKRLESTIHNYYYYYKYKGREEWLCGIEFNELINTIEDMQKRMDGEFISKTIDKEIIKEITSKYKVHPIENHLKNYKKPIKKEKFEIEANKVPENKEIEDNEENEDNEEIEEESPAKTKKKETSINEDIHTPENFEKYIKECFIKEPNARTTINKISERYRLWSKITVNIFEIKKKLYQYLEDNGFEKCYITTEDGMNSYAYSGLEIIPLKDLVLDDSDYSKYIKEHFVKNITGRLTTLNIQDTFIAWKRRSNPTYQLTGKIKRFDKHSIEKILEKDPDIFKVPQLHDSHRRRPGFYGISLIGHEEVGNKNNNKRRKEVEKIDALTGSVIETYISNIMACRSNDLESGNLSKLIKDKQLYKSKWYFRYKV